MRVRPLAVLALSAAISGLAVADDPPDAGKVAWAKDYPKVIDAKPGEAKGAVELLGEVEPPAGWGWTVTKVEYDYSPAAGGVLAKPTELKFRDGKWGELDKDKKKIVPAKVPMDKGKWQVRVRFQFTDAAGQPVATPYQTSWKVIEIK